MQKTIIIINPLCHQGTGWKRWLSIRSEVLKRLSSNCTELLLEKGVTLKEALSKHWQQQEPALLISAGGDGSIHYLVNYLLKEAKESVPNVSIGAIGLGSSNDFLKPFGEKIKGVPLRINMANETMHDVGVATFYDDTNAEHKKFFLINASVGVTAQANWNFNHPDNVLRWLKTRASGAAIIYTALSTILRHRNNPLSLVVNNSKFNTSVSNINILKLPFVSGSFFYKQPISHNDGQLALNVCMNMSRTELLSILNQLQKGKFPDSNKTLSEFTTNIDISSEQDFIFECDGETGKTRSLNVTVLPGALSILKD
ncbi:MAG TPA: diacylglycerol kinase family protein [Chitinophagaceae bacterium]|nr:diacylglycerol kinase family protein [Chitinophagaceae bacterium]